MSKEVKEIMGGAPYYIAEHGSGLFRVVSGIESLTSCDFLFNFNEDCEPLKLGEDITETPNRSLAILVKCSDQSSVVSLASLFVEECRKLCSLSFHDYVSIEKNGGSVGVCLGYQGVQKYFEVRPRLFRKIVND